MILTTPFGKKEGCDRVTTKRNNKREAMSLSIPQLSPNKSIRSHGFSLKLERLDGGISNTPGGFCKHSPTFETSLSNSIKFNTKEV